MLKKRTRKRLSLLTLSCAILAALLIPTGSIDARGFRGGGFRSSFGRSSRSRSSFFGRKSSSSRRSFSSRRSSRRPKISAADRKLATKAKSSGTYFKNRNSAKNHFKQNVASKYSSKYKTKPASKPSHIPQTTKVDGRQYNVGYNPTYGGYGYMHNGSWRFYEVARDTAMLSLLMRRNNYYYEPHGYGYGYRRSSNIFGTIIILGIIAFAIFFFIRTRNTISYQ